MRTLPTGLDAALSAVEVAPIFLVELDWPTGTVYAWNGYHVLNWNGIDWQPTGHLGGIAEIKESSDGTVNGTQLSMSGISAASIEEALENDSQGRPARIYHGVLSSTGFTIDPYLVFDGLIDFPSIVRNGSTATITVNLEKELYDDRSSVRRWNHEDQQIDFPGDLGFEYVAGIANQQFTWGKATTPTHSGELGNGGIGIEPQYPIGFNIE